MFNVFCFWIGDANTPITTVDTVESAFEAIRVRERAILISLIFDPDCDPYNRMRAFAELAKISSENFTIDEDTGVVRANGTAILYAVVEELTSFKRYDKVVIKHQRELGVFTVENEFDRLENPIKLPWIDKLIEGYVRITNTKGVVLGYHPENLERA